MGSLQSKTNSDFSPLNIGRIFISRNGEKIYGLVIESLVEVGVLRRLSEIAEKMGILIRYIQFSMPKPSEDIAKGIAFIDLTNSQASPQEILELVKKQKFVKSVRLIKPIKEGIVPDNYFFPLVVMDERAVILRKPVYEALFKGVRKQFGSAGEALLYYQGFNIGLKIYDEYVKLAGSKNVEDLTEIAKAVNMTLGWGIADIIEIDREKELAHLRIYQNFECELGKNSQKPFSQFYRGAIAGILTRFFGKEVKVRETKCIAKGDPYCEFWAET